MQLICACFAYEKAGFLIISSCDWLAMYKHLKAQVFNIILDLAKMEFKYRNKIYMKGNLLFVFFGSLRHSQIKPTTRLE